MFTRYSKVVSTITNARDKIVHYIDFFLWEFDCDLACSLKSVPCYQVSLYSMSATDRFDCIVIFFENVSNILLLQFLRDFSDRYGLQISQDFAKDFCMYRERFVYTNSETIEYGKN